MAGTPRTLLLALVAALAWTALASASATPVTPARNGVVATGTPLFTWTVPADETTTDVYVSTSRTTSHGAFPAAKVVDSQTFSNGERRWTPTRPLFGGSYWWLVKTRNADSTKSFYSAPRPFSVRSTGQITNLRLTRYTGSHHLFVSLKWRTNTKTSLVTLRVKRGSKVYWTARLPATSLVSGQEQVGIKTWERGARPAQGTRLTLTATLQAGSFSKTLSRPFVAP